jgi:hypothetical protein
MTAASISTYGNRFKVGWILLLALTALMTLNHVVLIFALDEQALFIGWSAFNLYALAMLWIPFRAGQKWAWYISWIMIAAFAVVILLDSEIGWMYLGTAAVMGSGMFLTYPAFFQQK